MGRPADPRPARSARGPFGFAAAAFDAHRPLGRASPRASVPANGRALGAAAGRAAPRARTPGRRRGGRADRGDPGRAPGSAAGRPRVRALGGHPAVRRGAARRGRGGRAGPGLPAALAARRAPRPDRAAVGQRAARPAGGLGGGALGSRSPAGHGGGTLGDGAERRPCGKRSAQQLLVVDESGRGYGFRHALARAAVHDDLLPGERAQLHRAYAEAIERSADLAGDLDASSMLAHHWLAAHDLPRALPASVRAGRAAAAASAPSAAQRHFELALELWHQVPDAEQRAGHRPCASCSRCAAEAARRAGAVERALALATRRSTSSASTGRSSDG